MLNAVTDDAQGLKPHRLGRGGEKGGFLADRFDEGDAQGPFRPHRRQNETGKTRARSEVDKRLRRRRDQRVELGGIEEVPAPTVRERRSRDEVVPVRPVEEQAVIRQKAFQRFT